MVANSVVGWRLGVWEWFGRCRGELLAEVSTAFQRDRSWCDPVCQVHSRLHRPWLEWPNRAVERRRLWGNCVDQICFLRTLHEVLFLLFVFDITVKENDYFTVLIAVIFFTLLVGKNTIYIGSKGFWCQSAIFHSSKSANFAKNAEFRQFFAIRKWGPFSSVCV